MTTRLVSIDQIARGPIDEAREIFMLCAEHVISATGRIAFIRCRQIADATGGDVFEPISGLEAGLAEALRRAKWPHPVQVEVVT